mmetsp:Transcript_35129/g.101524  ORF Transcript_35129/g.101524 Transcript_35129/m.101524 type:complete len:210 (-) Transcript_35129:938-1567(-)
MAWRHVPRRSLWWAAGATHGEHGHGQGHGLPRHGRRRHAWLRRSADGRWIRNPGAGTGFGGWAQRDGRKGRRLTPESVLGGRLPEEVGAAPHAETGAGHRHTHRALRATFHGAGADAAAAANWRSVDVDGPAAGAAERGPEGSGAAETRGAPRPGLACPREQGVCRCYRPRDPGSRQPRAPAPPTGRYMHPARHDHYVAKRIGADASAA